jgi:hypothetical protein
LLKTDVSYGWQMKYSDREWLDTHAIHFKCELMF